MLLAQACSLILLGSAGETFERAERPFSSVWDLKGRALTGRKTYCSESLLGGWAALSGTCVASA